MPELNKDAINHATNRALAQLDTFGPIRKAYGTWVLYSTSLSRPRTVTIMTPSEDGRKWA